MADWFNIVDAQVDPDAPLTSELAYAWRDNVIAIAEGAPGAPRVGALANAAPYVEFRSASGTSFATFTGISPRTSCIKVCFTVNAFASGGPSPYSFSLSNDGGASWSTEIDINFTGNANAGNSGDIMINLVDGLASGLVGIHPTTGASGPVLIHQSFPAMPGTNAIRFRSKSQPRSSSVTVCVVSGIQ